MVVVIQTSKLLIYTGKMTKRNSAFHPVLPRKDQSQRSKYTAFAIFGDYAIPVYYMRRSAELEIVYQRRTKKLLKTSDGKEKQINPD